MRKFSQGPVARGIAQALTLAFLWCAVLTGMGAPPAGAQVSTRSYGGASAGGAGRAAAGQSVAVVPFDNVSGYRPETFGQEASDAVATELRDRLLLDILPKADVEMWMRDLGYRPPFTDAELARLGTELEVTLLVSGQVRVAKVVQRREGNYAEVVLAVVLFDRVAQTAVNGALVTTRGPASTDASDDALMTKALQQGIFDAVQQMRTRPSVTAMVLWARESIVFLNVGGRAGVEVGMRMIATRDGLRIGLVEVTEASPIGSYAKIIEGPPLRTGDQLRAIYQLPTGVTALSPVQLAKKKKTIYNYVLAAVAVLGVADLGSTARSLSEGNLTAFSVSNLANGAIAAPIQAVSLPVLDIAAGVTRPAAIITWIPFSGTEKTRIWGYEIWRDQALMEVVPIQGVGMSENFAFDLPRPTFTQRVVSGTVTTLATGQPVMLVTANSRTIVTSQPAQVISYTDPAVSFSFEQTGMTTGLAYVYRVRPIVIDQRQVGTTTQWVFVRGAELSSFQNRITAVPPATSLRVTISGTTATFSFYSAGGADEAIVQIAKDGVTGGVPNNTFPASNTFSRTKTVSPGTASISVSLASDLRQLSGDGSTLWWRIGLRNRSDTTAPRPWPPTLSNDYGYVWREAAKLTTVIPTSREQQSRRERELLRRGLPGRPRDMRRPAAPREDRILRAE